MKRRNFLKNVFSGLCGLPLAGMIPEETRFKGIPYIPDEQPLTATTIREMRKKIDQQMYDQMAYGTSFLYVSHDNLKLTHIPAEEILGKSVIYY